MITVYFIHTPKYHKKSHYSVKYYALIKSISFKIKKYFHLKKCSQVTYGDRNDSAVVTRNRSQDAQWIRVSEFPMRKESSVDFP
jgi:hypothetical protein